MKEIEKEFLGTGEVKGTSFKQINVSDKGYIYELTDLDDGLKRYEVFERKTQKEAEVILDGHLIHYDAKIRYPKSKDFGDWAWCYTIKSHAEKKFYEL